VRKSGILQRKQFFYPHLAHIAQIVNVPGSHTMSVDGADTCDAAAVAMHRFWVARRCVVGLPPESAVRSVRLAPRCEQGARRISCARGPVNFCASKCCTPCDGTLRCASRSLISLRSQRYGLVVCIIGRLNRKAERHCTCNLVETKSVIATEGTMINYLSFAGVATFTSRILVRIETNQTAADRVCKKL